MAGIGLGVYYAWIISPLRYVDTSPDTLRADFKDQFRVAIAAAFATDHNLDRAKARLVLLGNPNSVQDLTALAQRMLGEGESFHVVQEIANLATDLQAGVASIPLTSTPNPTSVQTQVSQTQPSPVTGTRVPIETIASPTIESTSTAAIFDTPTPRPTRTAVPTAGAPIQLVSQDQVCNPNLTNGLMQISVLDSHHHQMPGMEIIITWNGGEEHFFTGFKPEIANGYADYVMQPGVIYTVRIEQSGIPVPNLSAPACPDTNGQTYSGGLKLIFQQP